MPPEYRQRIEQSRPQLIAMARQRYGVELNSGPFGIDSRPALIGAKYAADHNHGPAYNDAILRAYWQEGRDISDPAVIGAIAEQVGLNPVDFLAALNDPHYDQAVTTDVAQAHAYGLNGVPALIFNDKYLVSGAQPYELLVEVVEKVQSEMAEGE